MNVAVKVFSPRVLPSQISKEEIGLEEALCDFLQGSDFPIGAEFLSATFDPRTGEHFIYYKIPGAPEEKPE